MLSILFDWSGVNPSSFTTLSSFHHGNPRCATAGRASPSTTRAATTRPTFFGLMRKPLEKNGYMWTTTDGRILFTGQLVAANSASRDTAAPTRLSGVDAPDVS